MDAPSSQFFIVLDDKKKWKPYYPTDQIISAEDYLFNPKYQDAKKVSIINLCLDSRYLSLGHYCSLIAEARGHRALPAVKTMNDLQMKSLYIGDLDFVQDKVQKAIQDANITQTEPFKIFSLFGKCQDKAFSAIAKAVFDAFPAPILSIKFDFKKKWRINSIKIEPIDALKGQLEDLFAQTLDNYSNKAWRTPKNRKTFKYDLAILVTKDEALAPSNQKALEKFAKACKKLDVYCEIIEEKDLPRISEFDGLFIRTTTSISNYTYKFVKKAEMEGLVVIDDSDSIIKCTNKVYISNSLIRKKISIIPGKYVSKLHPEMYDQLIEEFGLPLVCKIPDGSFSTGVKKASTRDELVSLLEEMFVHSSLILVQKFMETQFDWRVGLIDGEPLFVCKYYMSQGHWQIYNHKKTRDDKNFSGRYETLAVYDTPKKVISAAVKAASIVGDGLYGVDLKEDAKGNVYIVEINDNPNIDAGVEDKVFGEKLYLKIIESFINRIERINT